MKCIVTCGPAYEPIDGARRLTNFSTGKLGATLCDALAHQGWRVICLRGEGATAPLPQHASKIIPFSTNEDLLHKLEVLASKGRYDAVLHAAALCDFKPGKVTDANGRRLKSAKYSTRQGSLYLELQPALKVLPLLPELFPDARVIGWKYELAGGRITALAKAWRQLRDAGTHACVLNGAAYGRGFALCHPPALVHHCGSAQQLAKTLIQWLTSP